MSISTGEKIGFGATGLLCFGLGWYAHQPATVTVDRVKYVYQVKLVTRDVIKEVAVAQIKVETKWRTRTVTEPGGTITVYQEVAQGSEANSSKATSETNDLVKAHSHAEDSAHSVAVLLPVSKYHIAVNPGFKLDTHGVEWAPKENASVTFSRDRIAWILGLGLQLSYGGAGVVVTGSL